MKKRLLSALLVFCMVLTILPGTAMAAEANRGYFGSKLSSPGQTVYDALCQNIEKIATGETINIPLKKLMGSEIKTDAELNALKESVPAARRAFDADRPDVFWSNGIMTYGTYIADDEGNIYNEYYHNREYIVGATVKMPIGVSWSSGGRSVSTDRAAVSSKVASIVADAKKQSTKVDQLKYAHDWLTSHNAYNKTAADTPNYIKTDCTPWTAISALDIDSNLAPVCEGYSHAFKMICDGLGIPCVLVSGKANGGAHMWTYVQLGGNWYAVDVTFDDPIMPGGGDSNGRDTYFLVGRNTKVNGNQTFADTHKNDDALSYPTLAAEKYDPSTVPTPVDVTAEAQDIEVTLPATVTNADIKGTAKTADGTVVAGHWEFVDTIPTAAGVHDVKVKFVPTDLTSYNVAEDTIKVTINAAPVEKITPVVNADDITATLGDTLTITGTAKDGEKDVAGTWTFVDVAPNTVGTHSDVKVEFIPDDTDAYNKAEDTITVTINAAPVEKVTPVVEANDITATLGDTLTITGTAKDGEKDVSGTWSFVDAAPNTAGTHENVKVKFTPDNTAAYNEVETSITVTINAAPVEKVTPVVEANDITATLGDTLTITGTAKDGEKDVSGTWSFVDAAPNTAGTHENVKVKFTPDNTTAYNEVETSITVTINAAPVEKVTPIVSANDITVTLGNALTITGTAKDGDKTVSGTWSFVDAAPNTVGTHENVKVRFTPTNTAAYNVAETTITVTINAAPVDPTTPIVTVDDISVPYGVTVKDSDIRGTSNVPGVWSFVGTVPTAVGSHRVTVRFTPNDTAAYKSVDRVITLRIYAVDHGDITDWVNFPHNDVIGRPVSNLVAEVVDWIFNQYGVRFAAADFNVYVNEYSVNLASIVRNDTRYVLHFNGNAADNAEFERLFNSRRTLTFGVERESGEEYYIALDKMENGQVIANTRYAESGARVTLSVHPDSGYELDTLEVTDVRGRTVTLRDLEDGRYSFTMPSNRVTVEATFMAVKEERPSLPGPDHTAQNPHDEIFTGLGTPGISGIVLNPAAMPFTDVHGPDWFYNHVEYMWKHYLMSGTTENRFDPNLTTSRAMIWTIMARMNNVRTDINPGSTWYEKGMLWAMERGITDGSNAMGDITREQLATMLWRNAGSPIAGGDLSRFSDADSVSAYALNAVRWASSNGILSGINGRIEPQGTATRAQVAAMVARYGDKVVR